MKKKKRRKMKPGGGAKKGSAFERKMANELSKWWFGEKGYLWRRPGPGTRFFKKDKHRHSGDIVPSVDRLLPYGFPFHVELKCFSKKRLKLDMLLWPERNPIHKIWKKATEELREGLIPMLLLKANNTPIVCVMRRHDVMAMIDRYNEKNSKKRIDSKEVVRTYVRYDLDDEVNWVIALPWDDLALLAAKKKRKKNG